MINWNKLAEAIEFYQQAGFQLVDVTWEASEAAMKRTFPDGSAGLIGSAEQSFLDNPPAGDAVACTPCFRPGDIGRSAFHRPYFMKVELWSRKRVPQDLVVLAQVFLGGAIVTTEPDTFDLELAGIEIGSYGRRRDLQGRLYTYGTGLAEPRYSLALQHSKKELK